MNMFGMNSNSYNMTTIRTCLVVDMTSENKLRFDMPRLNIVKKKAQVEHGKINDCTVDYSHRLRSDSRGKEFRDKV
jgi:hypothetical protein